MKGEILLIIIVVMIILIAGIIPAITLLIEAVIALQMQVFIWADQRCLPVRQSVRRWHNEEKSH